jgi:hypothetical protein
MNTMAGSAVHMITEALDLARLGIVSFNPTTPDEWRKDPRGVAARVLNDLIKENLDRSEGLYTRDDIRLSGRATKEWPNKNDFDFMVHHIPGWVQNWTDWLDNAPWDIWIAEDGQPGIELGLSFKVGNQDVTGSIDRVLVNQHTGEIAIVDLKGGAWVPKDLEQPELYAYGLFQKFGVKANVGGFFMNRTNKIERWGYLKPHEGLLAHKFDSTAAKAEQGLLMYDTEKCEYMCSVRDHCPIYGGKFAITTEDLLGSIQDAAKRVRDGEDIKSAMWKPDQPVVIPEAASDADPLGRDGEPPF